MGEGSRLLVKLWEGSRAGEGSRLLVKVGVKVGSGEGQGMGSWLGGLGVGVRGGGSRL